MTLIEIPPLLATGLVGEVLSAYETMPFLPGRAAIYLLVLLSTVSWSIILSKALLIWRIRRADQRFTNCLRRSQTCLEIFERGENHEPSLFFEIYKEGARAASIEMIGSANPGLTGDSALNTQGGMSRNQIKVIAAGFEYGEKAGTNRLRGGFAWLRIVATAAPLIGIVGGCWVLVTALAAESEPFRILLNHSLIIIMASLFVSAPAGIARIYLLNQCRRQVKQARRFRTRIDGVFADVFEKPEPVPGEKSQVAVPGTGEFDSPFSLDDESASSIPLLR